MPTAPAGRSGARPRRPRSRRPRTKPPSLRTRGCARAPTSKTSASRAQTDVAKAHKYAVEKFAEDLLPVKDALEPTLAAEDAAPEALRDGVELTLKQLQSAFDKAQVAEIDPARREIRSAPPPGDDDGRVRRSRRTPSSRSSRRATCSTTACCARRWWPSPRRTTDAAHVTIRAGGLIAAAETPI